MKPRRRRRVSTRTLSIQPLEQKALLAVISVAPGPGDDPAALLADAISQANQTAEPDQIELEPGRYDLSQLDEKTLVVSSEIAIVGQSPSLTSVWSGESDRPFEVTEDGKLSLSRMTVFGSNDDEGSIILNRGATTIVDAALIGTLDLENREIFSSPMIANRGTLDVDGAIFTDGARSAIENRGFADVRDSILVGNGWSAIVQLDPSTENGGRVEINLRDSTIFHNEMGFLGGGEVTISGSTITDNGQIGGAYGFVGGGVAVLDPDGNDSVRIDDDNVIVGNQSNEPELPAGRFESQTINKSPDIWIRSGTDRRSFSIGTIQQANQAVQSVSVETQDGVLQSDQPLEGVNVRVLENDGQLVVENIGLGASKVFWNEQSDRFLVESVNRQIDELYPLSDKLADVEIGTVIGNGASFQFNTDDLFLANQSLNSQERNSWRLLDVSTVVSAAGGTVESWTGPQQTANWFRYEAPDGFSGPDTITVTGTDRNGNQLTGAIELDVQAQTSMTKLNVAAADFDNLIDLAVSTSGFDRLNRFGFTVSFDPAVVRLTQTEFGRGYPFLQEVRSDTPGRVSVSAFNGFSVGNDLVMMHFQRIGRGPANIEILADGFDASSQVGQDLALGSIPIEYFSLRQDDVNRDGTVSASDALAIINHVAETSEAVGEDKAVTYERDLDTNGDQDITVADALHVINRVNSDSEADGSRHSIFSDQAILSLFSGDELPKEIARPGIPIDDGTVVSGVNLSPPTTEEFATASLVSVGASGIELQGSLDGSNDQILYRVDGTEEKVGFGLVAADGNHRTLSLTIWSADGELIDAYPTLNSSGFNGGSVATIEDEPIYFRVETLEDSLRSYQLDLIILSR